MAKPLNWILSESPGKRATVRLLRARLAATTILAVVPFLGYGRPAYAVCDTSSSVWVCSGTETGINNTPTIFNLTNTDAGVETSAHLTVTSDGVQVSGEGYIQFNDAHASSITNYHGHGLDVRAYDGAEGPYAKINITTNGTITGINGSGIYSRNFGSSNYHGDYGPYDTTIKVTGNAVITGTLPDPYEYPDRPADGINAQSEAGSITITTDANTLVRGYHNGIDAVLRGYSESSGSLTIKADGKVYGYTYDGIYARNGGALPQIPTGAVNLSITTGAQSIIKGAGHGIDAINNGYGYLNVEADGVVTGYSKYKPNPGDGVHASNSYRGTTLTITTGVGSTVTGVGDDGIDALQLGNGDLTINVNGLVTGRGAAGVDNLEDKNYAFGIEAKHYGYGSFEDAIYINISSAGIVEGKTAGIGAYTNNRYVGIYNEGTIRNLSGNSYDLAITTNTYEDAPTGVINLGNLIGTVDFRAEYSNDWVVNAGRWNMSNGISNFGGGYEDAIYNYGALVAADDSSVQEYTSILGLEGFLNLGGSITLVDGQAGDQFVLGEDGFTYYYGSNGHLAVDAALGPPGVGLSDQLIIYGVADGDTSVHVNVVAANGANTDGIPVVVLYGPQNSGNNFQLDAPVSGGFFTWDMRFDPGNNWYELFTVTANGDGTTPVLGAGAYEFPEGFAATQDIWFQTIGTILHRQADLRSLLQGGMNVTPVADYSEPVQPTPIAGAGAMMSPGFWFKGFGAYVERNDEQNGFNLDQQQSMYGGMAGFDFGTREAFANAWLFGVFGGYIDSDLKFTETNTKWNMQGPTVGAYVTYLDNAFYADATFKADFLDIKINPDELDMTANDSHTNAMNIGGRLDTGYKFGQTAFLEPQASLAVVHTEVDDVKIYGGSVKFDDDTSVRGRLGMRVGVDYTQPDATVYSADVTGSVWENFTGGKSDVTVGDTGLPDFGVSGNNQESTYGDVSLGVSAANPDGWSTFLRGDYVFANDYEAWTGNAGARFVW